MSSTAPATPASDAAGPDDQRSTVDVGNPGVEPGRTTVADVVVQKIAGRATREISGVYGFGGGTGRTFGAITERIPGARATAGRGVTVEVGAKEAAIDLDIVVEYGVPIVQLTQAIRRNVIGAVGLMTGLEVVEININVNDVHLPDDGDDAADTTAAAAPRVR
jgi:uncharacterized alkaline shock family protein YloU